MIQCDLFAALARRVRAGGSTRDRMAIKAAHMADDGKNDRDIAAELGCSVVDVPARVRLGRTLINRNG